jgi:outer membrane protease
MKQILLLTTLALVALVGPGPAHGQTAVQAWARRFNFTGASSFSIDEAQKIAVDASGNVIVAGSSNARITDYDWLIIKYTGAGVPLWTNRYNGPANGEDRASAVAVAATCS